MSNNVSPCHVMRSSFCYSLWPPLTSFCLINVPYTQHMMLEMDDDTKMIENDTVLKYVRVPKCGFKIKRWQGPERIASAALPSLMRQDPTVRHR